MPLMPIYLVVNFVIYGTYTKFQNINKKALGPQNQGKQKLGHLKIIQKRTFHGSLETPVHPLT